jgi:glycogen operon protein
VYGYRVFGPTVPEAGHRFNSEAVVLDPYASAVSDGHPWGLVNGHANGHRARRGRLDADAFDWGDDAPPAVPLAQTIIYELHVRGFTRHPSSKVRFPGTFLGLCEKIGHLRELGVTAVQLMPILEFDEHDHALRHPGTGEPLRNYWGYSTLSYFAPKAGYAARADQQVREFKEMVREFHRAGIEVILDVVYNHTSEGNERGPTLSFRGLDNVIYYMLDRQGRYYNFSGCGNTLNVNHPVVRRLVIDSLVYLATEFHVDGFRFDLASVFTRGHDGRVLEDPPLIQEIAEHPLLSGKKLFAEPWDAAGLNHLGKFPTWGRWAEFNEHFRDSVRRWVRSDPGVAAALAKRICGSIDVYGESARHPHHSINFITCHDGFTLNDLVSYDRKHNWANSENDRDGCPDNLSYNCGHEGPTDNAQVNELRHRQMRNFLTLLLVSQGIPFLSQGDEIGRTQHGNNNAYCQDNEISWVDWALAQKNAGLLRFTRMMVALRKRFFAISRDEFIRRVTWHGPRLGDPDWTGKERTLAFHFHGWRGLPDLYLMFNAHWESQRFALPHQHHPWCRLVDTALASPDDIALEENTVRLQPGDHYCLTPRSTVILIAR